LEKTSLLKKTTLSTFKYFALLLATERAFSLMSRDLIFQRLLLFARDIEIFPDPDPISKISSSLLQSQISLINSKALETRISVSC
jgi:hypothetical protein